jgi:hypothetical protein
MPQLSQSGFRLAGLEPGPSKQQASAACATLALALACVREAKF